PGSRTAHPSPPSVTMTGARVHSPRAFRLADMPSPAADAGSPGRPLTRARSSSSFGVNIGRNDSSPGSPAMTGAGFRIHVTPAAALASIAAATAARGISVLTSTTCAVGSAAASAARTCAADTAPFAPGPMVIWFSPRGSTTMSAAPVGSASSTAQPPVSTPSPRNAAIASLPEESAPTAPISSTSAPAREAATAALAPLPPPKVCSPPPMTVSPGAGRRGATITRSVLIAPTTSTRPAMTSDPHRLRRRFANLDADGVRLWSRQVQPLNEGDQQLGRAYAHLVCRLAHGGQAGREQRRHGDVVEPDDADLLGHLAAGRTAVLECADGHH